MLVTWHGISVSTPARRNSGIRVGLTPGHAGFRFHSACHVIRLDKLLFTWRGVFPKSHPHVSEVFREQRLPDKLPKQAVMCMESLKSTLVRVCSSLEAPTRFRIITSINNHNASAKSPPHPLSSLKFGLLQLILPRDLPLKTVLWKS